MRTPRIWYTFSLAILQLSRLRTRFTLPVFCCFFFPNLLAFSFNVLCRDLVNSKAAEHAI